VTAARDQLKQAGQRVAHWQHQLEASGGLARLRPSGRWHHQQAERNQQATQASLESYVDQLERRQHQLDQLQSKQRDVSEFDPPTDGATNASTNSINDSTGTGPTWWLLPPRPAARTPTPATARAHLPYPARPKPSRTRRPSPRAQAGRPRARSSRLNDGVEQRSQSDRRRSLQGSPTT
jgi:hypothetical protein